MILVKRAVKRRIYKIWELRIKNPWISERENKLGNQVVW